jgi:hypothetical protein
VGFLEKLDRALRAVLGNPLDILYDKASALFDTFCKETHLQISRATKEEFVTVVAAPIRRLGLRVSSNEKALTQVLLEHIIESPVELSVRIEIGKWLEQKFPET